MKEEQWEELVKYGRQLDSNLKNLSNTREEILKIQSLLQFMLHSRQDDIRVTINKMSDKFELLEQQLVKLGLPKIDYYDHEFTKIKDMIQGKEWPEAVENIVRDENYEKSKANSILDLIVIDSMKGKKVLDFGCGNGYLSKEIHNRDASQIVGYDPNGSNYQNGNLLLTTEIKEVVDNAPYDYIILFDVLDHCENPINTLKSIEEFTTTNTKVIVRNHPFCSRHGKHLFTTMNKAFIHMVLDDMEMMRFCGNNGYFTQKVLRPIQEYKAWISETDFEITYEGVITTNLEPYFTSPENYYIRDRIMQKYEGEDPAKHMQIDFIDYKLRKKTNIII